MSWLDVDDLTISYNGTSAVSGLNLGVDTGEIVALIGPSGSGKTSVLHAVNRLLDMVPRAQISGHVRIDGEDVYASGTDVQSLRRRIGLIFQKPTPFPLSIRRNIAWPLDEHGVSRKEVSGRVEEALRQAALWEEVCDRLDAPAYTLSGGQQQRLSIARALALRPDLLLMDEPTSALDPTATTRIESMLLKLKTKIPILFVTHNLFQARRISDRTYILWPRNGSGGILVESGETTAVFDNPQSSEAREYLGGQKG